jgi:hypothetical protein
LIKGERFSVQGERFSKLSTTIKGERFSKKGTLQGEVVGNYNFNLLPFKVFG